MLRLLSLRAAQELVGNLGPMLAVLVGQQGMLHEVSSIVADAKAPRQCVHADTIVLPCPQFPDVSMEPLCAAPRTPSAAHGLCPPLRRLRAP